MPIMPIPKPKDGESRSDFVGRCASDVSDEYSQNQALAICHAKWNEEKGVDPNADLLKAISDRGESKNSFNYGIVRADRYVKTLQDCIGYETCNRVAAKGKMSFFDTLKKSSRKLTYNNVDTKVEDVYADFKSVAASLGLSGVELPKNTLSVFRNVLTTPRKDRDGDIMRTEGAYPDPNMLLLWQHIHTMPIGKMLGIVHHDDQKLEVLSAIVDCNELSHDAAVMIENKMGRFSHGFKALSYQPIKSADGKEEGGFDVDRYEIMEESLVSVPSNVDAETVDIYLTLVEGKQLSSLMMKEYASHLRSNMPKKFGLGEIEKDKKDDDKSTSLSSSSDDGDKSGCSCGGNGKDTSPSDEAGPSDGGKTKEVTDTKEMKCPKCGGKMNCTKCGYKDINELMEKAGRTLSSSNYNRLVGVKDSLVGVHNMHVLTRTGQTKLQEAIGGVTEVLMTAGYEEEDKAAKKLIDVNVLESLSSLLASSTKEDRHKFAAALSALQEADDREQVRKEFEAFLGPGLS